VELLQSYPWGWEISRELQNVIGTLRLILSDVRHFLDRRKLFTHRRPAGSRNRSATIELPRRLEGARKTEKET